MQYSFYGGQQGKSFEIATIFHNKVEMMQDLMQRYSSNISIGDYVFISYGAQNEQGPSYTNNADIDAKAFGYTYNATLWQKIYTEEGDEPTELTEYVSKDFGLGYKLIASLTGNTPVFKVEYDVIKADQKPSITINVDSPNSVDFPLLTFHLPASQVLSLSDTIVLDVNEKPSANYDNTNVDKPSIQFSLPQAQEIKPENVSTTILDAGEDPEVVVDTTGNNADGTKKINKPTVIFKLPQGQQILPANVSTTKLDANKDPTVVFDNDPIHTNADGSKKVNRPSLEFKIPQSQVISLGAVTPLDADKNPVVALDETNINKPKLNISLPRSQVLQLNPTIVLAPSKDPDASYDDSNNINAPELTFSLPRAVKFMYGNRLGQKSAITYTLTIAAAPEIADLNEGDYYINDDTGFIYLVTGETATDRTFKFQACLAAPEPSVQSAAVDTYESNGANFVVKEPSIATSWSNPTDQIGLMLDFNLPKLPNLKGAITFCGPDETGSITGKPTSTNEFTYSFTLPTGAHFFCGSEVDDNHLSTVVTGAKPGDFYINGVFEDENDGNVYKLGTDNIWVKDGNIKGNVGNPLNITSSFTITPAQVATDDKDAVAAYLETQLTNKPDGHEIIAVTYRAPANGGGTIDTAYWYFVTNNTWNRVQLTGATASLIENAYKSTGDSNKAYSVTYINNLLAALDTVLTSADKKIKTYSAEAIEGLVSWGSFADL